MSSSMLAAVFDAFVTRSGLIALAGALLLLLALRWHRRLWRAIAPQHDEAPRLIRYPSITMVRPVRGCDVGAEANYRAALDTGYPGEVETLFIFDDEEDPGLPLARAVVAEHRATGRPGRAEVIVAGTPPPGRTGKLNAMILGEERAHGTLIGFGDSDTRPDHQVLRGVVDALLTTPQAGSAFAPVVVDQPARAAGDALYAIMQNALYSPLAVYVAGRSRTLPFIMGQLMVFRRSALSAIGGVRAAQGQLVDDMALGRALARAGYANVMSRHPLFIATGGMTLPEFLPVYRRWLLFAKNGLPASFKWRQWANGVGFFAALALAIAAGVVGAAWAAVPALLAVMVLGGSPVLLQRRFGGSPLPLRFWWAGCAVWLLGPGILLTNLLHHDVSWRGRVYALVDDAALAPEPPGENATVAGVGAPRAVSCACEE
jgi:ceramide glucosyltransferase